jgi:hypothetical protein
MTSVGILPEPLQTALHELVDRVNASDGGVRMILLSTSEGVALQRIPASEKEDLLDESLLQSLESTWAPAPKQLALLKLKRIQQVTAEYSEKTSLIHLYYSPVVVTLVLEPNPNFGVITSTCIPLLETILEPLCTTLLDALHITPNTTSGTIL